MFFYQDSYKKREEFRKLLESSEWPKAMDEELVSSDELARAHSTLYLMVGPDILPHTKNLLDFGCGNSRIPEVAAEYGVKRAIGYDIRPTPLGTTSFGEICSKGPYDVIVVNDVLDHLVTNTIKEAVGRIASLLSPHGHAFVRCHPYVSRAGTHLPSRGINKAYAHLFLPELNGEYAIPLKSPGHTYEKAFAHNNLTVEYQIFCRQKVDDFFTTNDDLFQVFQEFTGTQECFQMRLQNAEYVLRKF